MRKQERIDYWVDIAEYDLITARAMLETGRHLYVVFMCQQAIEKIIKAIYIQKYDVEPPRSHNLAYVFNKLNLSASEQIIELFTMLTAYYIETRYPTYKERLSTVMTREKAEQYFERTQEAFRWLKSQLL